ncbi:DUF4834 family protein [Arcticibacter eurypsychrophilus]|uniref:DUF4834 family protein n=1 Tax=Arcticibacter eurypsychrophilus TaxID=1434752 RepID=UPI00084D9835|nr:DUF4834 family protein [Arcticibacter eurypsychrophilus]
MTALLKFLLITILVMWLIRMIAKLLLPFLFKKMVKKAQDKFNSSTGQQPFGQQQAHPPRTNGKISIDFIPPKDKEARAADKAGDFIDFEDLK